MSVIKKPPLLDETGQKIVDAMERQNVLQILSSNPDILSNVKILQAIARTGHASDILNVGQQVKFKWKDLSADDNAEYDMPFDIVHMGNVECEDGVRPGIWLMSHYATLNPMPFNQREAFMAMKQSSSRATMLDKGTYHFTIRAEPYGNLFGIQEDTSYQFTLTKIVSAGGQIRFSGMDPTSMSVGLNGLKVNTYPNNKQGTPSETVDLKTGSDGIDLGTYSGLEDPTYITIKNAKYHMNTLLNALFGSGAWENSVLDQWLNSSAGKGNWWNSYSDFDVEPEVNATMAGFLSGMPEDLIPVLTPVKVKCLTWKDFAQSDQSQSTPRQTISSYSRVFIPSIANFSSSNESLLSPEGECWDYYKLKTIQLGKNISPSQIMPQELGNDHQNPIGVWTRSSFEIDQIKLCLDQGLGFKMIGDQERCQPCIVIC